MVARFDQHANVVIAAGFLLANSVATMAKKFPDTHFAITDYPVEAAPFADRAGLLAYRDSTHKGAAVLLDAPPCAPGTSPRAMAEPTSSPSAPTT